MKYLSILLLFVATTVLGQWHRLPGPPAPGPRVIATNPDSKILYAATTDGVWRATTIEGPWSPLGLRGERVGTVASYGFSGQGEVLFATLDTTLMRSVDTGKSWQSVYHGHSVFTIMQDGSKLSIIADTALLRSSDLGSTWIWDGFLPGPVTALNSIPNYYFFATTTGELWRIPRSGGPTQKTSYPTWQGAMSIASSGSTVLVGSMGRVDLSTDGGTSWLPTVSYGLDTTRDNLYSLAVHGLTMVAAAETGIYASSDAGRNWHRISAAIDADNVSYVDSNFIYSRNAGLYYSPDATTWHFVTMATEAALISKIVSSDSTVFVRTTGAVFQSKDRGMTWVAASELPWLKELVTTQGQVFALGEHGFWIWRGGTWKKSGSDEPVTSIAVIGSTIFAQNIDGAIYRSSDSAVTWSPLINPPAVQDAHLFATGDTLYELASQLYSSTDGGITWTQRYSFAPQAGRISGAVVKDNVMAVRTENAIYWSRDYGRSFEATTDDPQALAVINGNLIASSMTHVPAGVRNVWTDRVLMPLDVAGPAYVIDADDSLLYVGTSSRGLWAAPLDQLPLSVRSEHQLASSPIELYPNPAREKTQLHFELTQRGAVRLDLFNSVGETVRTEDLGFLEAGAHDVPVETTWLTTGVYSVGISGEQSRSTARLIVSH